jgi:Fe2+ transport system protein FeoA
MAKIDPGNSLLSLKKGSKARIIKIDEGDNVCRLMLSQGLRVGSVIDILHQRKRGVVIGNGATRIALGHDMAKKLHVQSIG